MYPNPKPFDYVEVLVDHCWYIRQVSSFESDTNGFKITTITKSGHLFSNWKAWRPLSIKGMELVNESKIFETFLDNKDPYKQYTNIKTIPSIEEFKKTNRSAILCNNREEWKAICKLLKPKNHTIVDMFEYTVSDPSKKSNCITCNENDWASHCYLEYYKKNNYTIYNASDFFNILLNNIKEKEIIQCSKESEKEIVYIPSVEEFKTIGKNAIHCESEEQWNNICDLLSIQRFKDKYEVYRPWSCICSNLGDTGYANLDYFKENNFNIYNASDFLSKSLRNINDIKENEVIECPKEYQKAILKLFVNNEKYNSYKNYNLDYFNKFEGSIGLLVCNGGVGSIDCYKQTKYSQNKQYIIIHAKEFVGEILSNLPEKEIMNNEKQYNIGDYFYDPKFPNVYCNIKGKNVDTNEYIYDVYENNILFIPNRYIDMVDVHTNYKKYTPNKFKVGDTVKIIYKDPSVWIPYMDRFLNNTGKITKINSKTNHLEVTMYNSTFTYTEKCLELVPEKCLELVSPEKSNSKVPELPEGYCWPNNIPEYRTPKENEWYISNSFTNPNQAAFDFTKTYWIIEPIKKEKIKSMKTPDFKVGDQVIITHKVEKEEGWDDSWNERMNSYINKIGKIILLNKTAGIRVIFPDNQFWNFPSSSIKLLESTTTVSSVVSDELLKTPVISKEKIMLRSALLRFLVWAYVNPIKSTAKTVVKPVPYLLSLGTIAIIGLAIMYPNMVSNYASKWMPKITMPQVQWPAEQNQEVSTQDSE